MPKAHDYYFQRENPTPGLLHYVLQRILVCIQVSTQAKTIDDLRGTFILRIAIT